MLTDAICEQYSYKYFKNQGEKRKKRKSRRVGGVGAGGQRSRREGLEEPAKLLEFLEQLRAAPAIADRPKCIPDQVP